MCIVHILRCGRAFRNVILRSIWIDIGHTATERHSTTPDWRIQGERRGSPARAAALKATSTFAYYLYLYSTC